MKTCIFFFGLLFLLSGCVPGAYNTLPEQRPHVIPEAMPESTLYIPPGLKIVSVEYDAEFFTVASDGTTLSEGEVGRAFISVYAEHQQSGEQYLLIYENLLNNTRPIQVIRFQEE